MVSIICAGSVILYPPSGIRIRYEMGGHFNMIDQNNILDYFIASEAEVLTKEQINDPTIPVPITTCKELWDRYNEWVMCLGLEPGFPSDDEGDAIEGIYLKPGTLAAKRLAARGKKYPTFNATRDYEKWRKGGNEMKEAIDQLEDYANGDNGLPPFPKSSKL